MPTSVHHLVFGVGAAFLHVFTMDLIITPVYAITDSEMATKRKIWEFGRA